MRKTTLALVPPTAIQMPFLLVVTLWLNIAMTGIAQNTYFVNNDSIANDLWCSSPGSPDNDGLTPATPLPDIHSVIVRYAPSFGDTIYVDSGEYSLNNTLELPDTGPPPGAPETQWFKLIGANRRSILICQDASTNPSLFINQDFTHVEGFQIYGGTTAVTINPQSCRNARIEKNSFIGQSSLSIEVLSDPLDEGFDTYSIRNNICSGGGMSLQAGIGFKRAAFDVVNNTVAISQGTGIACGGHPGMTMLINNIISAKDESACLSLADLNIPQSSNFNNFYAHGGAAAVVDLSAANYSVKLTLSQWQAISGLDLNSFNRNPLFTAQRLHDYHLRSQGGSWQNGSWVSDFATSPCVDAGDPAMPLDKEPPANGGIINMGAYGNTEQASRSSPVRSLLLLAPCGGNTYSEELAIAWLSSGQGWLADDSVRLQVATDDSQWFDINDTGTLPASGTFNWKVPAPLLNAGTLKLRVICSRDATVSDATESLFYVQRIIRNYYVNDDSTEGDQYCTAPGATLNTGTAPDQPLPSLDEVLARYTLEAGDTVYLDRGIYVQNSDTVIAPSHKGVADNPIIIRGVGEKTILSRMPDGEEKTNACIQVFADHLKIENVTCVNGDIGIAIDASSARNVTLTGNSCLSNSVAAIRIEPRSENAGGQYRILQNVIAGDGAGLELRGGVDLFGNRTVFIIENNTIVCGGDGIHLLNNNRRGTLANLLKNNLIHTTRPEHACLVVLPGTLHYSDFNNLHADNGAAVGAWQLASGTRQYFTSLPEWHAANAQDQNSISFDTSFIKPESGNFRVPSDSPCVDAGINSFWMFKAYDRGGQPRISGTSSDIGAYEVNVSLSVRLFLSGALAADSNQMSCTLNDNLLLPQISPYAADRRKAANIPDNITDWVLLEFRGMANDAALYSRSAFLRCDGWVVDDDGNPELAVDLPAQSACYIVVRHRNHLAAMSAEPITFAGDSLVYDFTVSSEAYFGGENACITVNSQQGTFCALRCADSDGDGEILSVDLLISQSQFGIAGYNRGDINCDGVVSIADEFLINENLNFKSAVPHAATILQPALLISPARRTISSATSVTLKNINVSAANESLVAPTATTSTTSGWQWAFVHNRSGADIVPHEESEVVYTAGGMTGRTDVVEAWHRDNRLGRSRIDVVSTQLLAKAGKAMIVAGRKSADDTLWPTTDYLADNAYATLRCRGFSKENIIYLNPVPDQDVDGNGILDDIDAASGLQETAAAITNELAGANQIFIYLVDHGGNSSGCGYFRLNQNEILTAAQLDSWLDSLQESGGMKVTVLLDFCYAGSFLSELTYSGTAERIVIAACNDAQPSYFVAGGLVSFSGAFFSGVLLGHDVMQCFSLAQSAMSAYQSAQLDDDKDGCYTTNDYSVASETYVGPSSTFNENLPQIGEICGNQILTDETTATLWIGSVTALHPLSKTWCLVIPPNHDPNPDNPVTDLPQLDLNYDSSNGRYEITYDGFTAAGTYKIQFYAQDEAGNISAPRESYVSQVGYADRVIFVAGGTTNSSNQSAVDYLTQLAYTTFRLRLFASDHIRIISPDTEQDLDDDGYSDVFAEPNTAAIQEALAWATTNTTDRLTLYLLGEGVNNTFRLNESECLSTNQLATWLDAYQATNPVPINVILDFSGAGTYLTSLASDQTAINPDASRIVIASSQPAREALLANGGTVSFSQYLLAGIIAGKTLGYAYTDARRAIRRVSGGIRQRAQIDDNNNGTANEKNVDGVLANATTLGSAFVTGADSPEIGAVMPVSALPAPGAPITIWASGIAGMNTISDVWCVVTPPTGCATNTLDTITLTWNAITGRHEAQSTAFLLPGTHILTFYAQDELGSLSEPVQTEIILPDACEPDDTPQTAALYHGIAQQRNFHSVGDTDWTRVYLVTNFIYDFETYHFSDDLDTVLAIYRELPDGKLQLIDHVDEEGSDYGEYTGIDFPESGWYLTCVTLYTASTNTPIGTYELSIEIPAADGLGSLIVLGVDDVHTSALPTDTTVTVEGTGTMQFNGSKSVVFSGLTNGTYLVSVPEPDDFIAREDPLLPDQVTSLTNIYYANPRLVEIDGGWRMAGFEMLSTLRISSGVVRDAWTHAFLKNAQISFTATSGSLTGTVVTGNMILTDYSTNWLSGVDGLLPSDIILGACNWDMQLTLAGYEPYILPGAVSNRITGAEVDLDTLYLTPVDANSNSVADTWENLYFPGGMSKTADSDSDGVNNLHEYLCGTDPTNTLDFLRFVSGPTNTTQAAMRWSTVGGRSYQIIAVTSLVENAVITTNGPWEALYNQTSMEWCDTNAPAHKSRFYRVRLVTP